MRRLRIRLTMLVARALRVPIQVGYSFMASGKNASKP